MPQTPAIVSDSSDANILLDPALDSSHYFLPSWQLQTEAVATPNAISPGISLDGSSPSLTWRPDEFTLNQGYQDYKEELRSLIFNTANSAAPTRQASPAAEGGERSDPDFVACLDEELRAEAAGILAVGGRTKYLRNYVAQVAPWLDMFDSDRAFGTQLTAMSQTSPALLYAILALSARQMERKDGKKNSFDSLELYQEAIRLLAPLLQERHVQIVPICTILCCLEMMSASAQDWRRHLEGCAALFDTFGVHGFSGGLLQAVFWCYARMDLCGALISDGTESTLVPPRQWLVPGSKITDSHHLFRSTPHPDMHANYAVFLCARVCELISERTRFVELGEQNGCSGPAFEEQWVALWGELQAWMSDRPPDFVPIRTVDASPFPEILFARWSAISSNQLHHTSCILMLDMMPKPVRLRVGMGTVGSALWHAKRVCGISATNPHHGCLNNAIQPLWVAGRLLSHRSEHSQLVKLIWNIEALTGWGTSWRIADLEAVWGYRVKRGNITS